MTFTAALSLPTGKTSVMHLVIREKLPDEHSQGDLLHIVIIVMGFSLAFSFVHFLDFSHHLLTFTRGSYIYRAIILYIYIYIYVILWLQAIVICTMHNETSLLRLASLCTWWCMDPYTKWCMVYMGGIKIVYIARSFCWEIFTWRKFANIILLSSCSHWWNFVPC